MASTEEVIVSVLRQDEKSYWNEDTSQIDANRCPDCPDCHEKNKIKVATAGIQNMHKTRRNSQNCRNTIAKKQREKKGLKNEALDGFLRPRPAFIALTGAKGNCRGKRALSVLRACQFAHKLHACPRTFLSNWVSKVRFTHLPLVNDQFLIYTCHCFVSIRRNHCAYGTCPPDWSEVQTPLKVT